MSNPTTESFFWKVFQVELCFGSYEPLRNHRRAFIFMNNDKSSQWGRYKHFFFLSLSFCHSLILSLYLLAISFLFFFFFHFLLFVSPPLPLLFSYISLLSLFVFLALSPLSITAPAVQLKRKRRGHTAVQRFGFINMTHYQSKMFPPQQGCINLFI